MTDTTPVLSIRDLSVEFSTDSGPVHAVKSLSLDVHRGQTLAIVGESGSGKSTLASSINRLLPGNARVTSGTIDFRGENLVTASEQRMRELRGAGIGLVPQDPMSNLDPLFRVGDQIAEALEVHGRARGAEARKQAIDLLTLVGIEDPARRVRQLPHEFSGGMRQRVLIAMALACRPPLVIADEPTSALDVTVQRRILDRLSELAAQMGSALVLITHDLALAAERADTVLVMYRGDLVEQGAAAEILGDPQHEYTKRLLAAAPSLNSTRVVDVGLARAETETEPLVRIESLTKVFPLRGSGLRGPTEFTAVDDASFVIHAGETVSIVGESGSGKSTLAKMVLRLEDPTSGRIVFGGTDVTSLHRKDTLAFRRRIQPVFQNPYSSFDPRVTIDRSIIEPLQVHGVGDTASRKTTMLELLDKVALPRQLATRYPHELSGGQRQRVAIARALALSPELVVLDEAVSALDVLVQAQILDLLVSLQRDLGLSYLFISHDLAVVRLISHEVHVMQRGRIVESGTPDDIFGNPREDYTKELLAAIPRPKAA